MSYDSGSNYKYPKQLSEEEKELLRMGRIERGIKPAEKLQYSDIQLNDKVYSPNKKEVGQITGIDNAASLVGITEPIFTVRFKEYHQNFGLKYILKMIVK